MATLSGARLQRKAARTAVSVATTHSFRRCYESWMDARKVGQPTAVMTEWARIKQVNPAAKLVCLDLQPHSTTQAPTRDDVLNIGGFSDAVYGVITAFAASTRGADGWVKAIEAIEL